MTVTEAIAGRTSVRAFLDRPVDAQLLRRLIEQAARSPSGGNLQPWRLHVLGGEPLAELKSAMTQRLRESPEPDPPDYLIYPPQLWEPYRSERFAVGEALYGTLGIPREDKRWRLAQLARNFQFFGAPVGLFCYVDRDLGSPQWADLGMYLQTLMLLLHEHGLGSCAQEAWSMYHRTVAAQVVPPEAWMLFCGMAIGYPDSEAPVNALRTERMVMDDYAVFRGI